jgi:predicted nuclease with TOPRIM domain
VGFAVDFLTLENPVFGILMTSESVSDLRDYASLVSSELEATTETLKKLAQERSHLSLLLSERIRKITDYKSKFCESVIRRMR